MSVDPDPVNDRISRVDESELKMLESDDEPSTEMGEAAEIEQELREEYL